MKVLNQEVTVAKIAEALKMQDQLNIATNGENWKSGYTDKNKKIDWNRCIYGEAVECNLDSMGWKHWKDIHQPINFDNMRIEVVDMWHFLLSGFMEQRPNSKDQRLNSYYFGLAQELYSEMNEIHSVFWKAAKVDHIDDNARMSEWGRDDALIPFFSVGSPYWKFFDDNNKTDARTDMSWQSVVTRHLESLTLNAITALLAKDVMVRTLYEHYMRKDFFTVMFSLEMDIDELHSLYLSKNVLNSFRQHNGYAGTGEVKYIKLWGEDKIEDNVFIQQFLEKSPNATASEIYNHLDLTYKKLNNITV